MNLRNLSDDKLLFETSRLAKQDRETLTALLHHLKEIDSRRLFCKLKYGSLFQYIVSHLGYSEDEAYRRMAAVKMIKELPQVEEKIREGTLTLSNITKASSLFNKKKKSDKAYDKTQKLELLESLEGKSARQADRIIAAIEPEVLQPDKVRPIAEDRVQFNFSASLATEEKINQVKALYAHSHPNISMDELMNLLCDIAINQHPKTATSRVTTRQKPESKAGVRRAIFARDRDTCVNCGSRFATQGDHIIPRAKGGPDTLENQRVLCRSCNQRAAIEQFGMNKMSKYLKCSTALYSSSKTSRARTLVKQASHGWTDFAPPRSAMKIVNSRGRSEWCTALPSLRGAF